MRKPGSGGPTGGGWVLFGETSDEAEAYIVKGLLEDNDIPCHIIGYRTPYMVTIDRSFTNYKLLVPEEELEKAEFIYNGYGEDLGT